ncbi:MAG: FAD-dependent oxidoreductase [Eubacterium sp.]|nr:FAD-dependent oxidoreductase [Eubacterium sp.]
MFDCIIIGTGPAGLSAALNLKKYNKDFVWFGTKRLSDKVIKAEMITNYPGLPNVSGPDLFKAFDASREAAGLEITEKTVTNVMKNGNTFMVLADNDIYEAKSIILCIGVMNAKLLEGEDRLLGRGLSYCATCDGQFYRDKKIAVITNDAKYEHEVEYLADLAEEVIYLPTFKDSVISRENVTFNSGVPAALEGEAKVEKLVLKNGEVLEVDGVFALRNAIVPTKLFPQLEVDGGHVVVDRGCRTNLEGCFAAGDCTGLPYQYTKAVGEGNVAALNCITWLAEQKLKENA